MHNSFLKTEMFVSMHRKFKTYHKDDFALCGNGDYVCVCVITVIPLNIYRCTQSFTGGKVYSSVKKSHYHIQVSMNVVVSGW